MIWSGAALLFAGAILAFAVGGDIGSVDARTAGIVTMVFGGVLLIVGIVRLNHGRRVVTSRARAHDVRVAGRGPVAGDVPVAGRGKVAGDVPAGGRGGVTGGYRGRVQEQMYRTSKGKMIAMIVAVVYILSPADIVPDVLLPVGIVDDATAFTWLLFAIGQEISRKRRSTLPPPSR